VAVASYGTAQDHFLRKIVAEYHGHDMDCRVVVLSNIDKPVEGAEVLVGLPSKNTYSLPFAHRALFRKHADEYDLFIYAEDDTLITAQNVRAFLDVQRCLRDDEILGFLRSETSTEGVRYIVSANHYFRWLPASTITRGTYRLAEYSNQHSGCFIATRAQLSRAIASGGFTVEPREDRYGMLETAASDIYTQCGLKRVLCLSRLDDFIVPHLANKYFQRMGIPLPEFAAQADALCKVLDSPAATKSLFNPETRAPGFRWSKDLYRPADHPLLDLVPATARRVLSVGATMGHDEVELLRRGFEVEVIPMDAVFGATLRRLGLKVHTTGDASCAPDGSGFDVVLAADALHLVSDPVDWLRSTATLLRPGGEIVGSVSNTASPLWTLKDWRSGHWRWVKASFTKVGAHPMSKRRLSRLCRISHLELLSVVACSDGTPSIARVPSEWLRRLLAPRLLYRLRRSH
jgi:SAM-dependent methyltransferase